MFSRLIYKIFLSYFNPLKNHLKDLVCAITPLKSLTHYTYQYFQDGNGMYSFLHILATPVFICNFLTYI